MPTVSPIARAVIGATSEDMFRQPRASITRPTGMDVLIPKKEEPKETGQPVITEETKSDAVTLSPQLTALAKKQQKLQQEVQALRDREAAFTTKEADHIPKSSLIEGVKKNALQTIKDTFGMDYEELTNLILSQTGDPDPVKELKSEIQQLKTNEEQRVSKQYEATVNQYKKEIEALVSTDANFVTIKEEGAQEAVLQHILDTFNNDNEILTVEEASKDIEEFLVEDALKKTGLTKIKSKLAPQDTEKKLPPPSTTAANKQAPKTLTNSVETSPTRSVNQFQHLSMKERIAQAIQRAQR